MERINFWKKYLLIISYVILVIGVYVAFFKTTILYKPFNLLIDPVFWPDGIQNEGTILYKYFVYSLMGVCMMVWGIFLYQIIKNAYDSHKKWVWKTILITTVVWFLIDESFSIIYKVYYNAIFNVILFIAIIIPIIYTRKYFNE